VVDFVNQRWLEYTGLSLEEALANATRTVHPEDLPGVMEKWRTDMAAGEPCEDEMRLRRADGEYRWFLVRTVPLRNEQGNIVKWYGTSTDITERKKAENALRDSGVQLQALTRRLVELQESERAGPGVEIALFRIAQEALNNVAKHAQATSVVISFGSAGSEWRMSVVDDGVGLRPHEAGQPRGGFGLVTMRERAQAIGGRF